MNIRNNNIVQINLTMAKSRTLHLYELSVPSDVNVGEEFLHSFAVVRKKFFVLKVSLNEHGLEVASLIEKDGTQKVPQCEFWP